MPYNPLSSERFTFLQGSAQAQRQMMRANEVDLQAQRSALAQVNANLANELAKGVYADQNLVNSLLQNQSQLQGGISQTHARLGDLDVAVAGILDELTFQLDPRTQVGFLDDSIPIFMMPLRVEVRFMTIKHIARVGLEVAHAIPEPTLIMRDERLYREPAPVEAHRIFDTYQHTPIIEDVHELWIRIFPDDIAVHTHETLLTAIEEKAGQEFWRLIWYAGPDQTLRQGAWRGLVSGRDASRAAWVAKQTRPTNPSDQPSVTTDPNLPLPIPPAFAPLTLKQRSWTEAAHSRVMPDRLIARLYNGSTYREVVGKQIPDPLPLSIDPDDPTNAIDPSNSNIVLPPKLRWLQDFEEAEKIGMGIRVPLDINERMTGFTKIIVAGVKTSADANTGKKLLEDLIDNHHYTGTGFSIVAQGTPTNNTEDAAAGHTENPNDDDALFELEIGADLFTPTSDLSLKTDGQYLADALGIEYGIVQHIRNADIKDIKEAMCMNMALWPSTLGYYLRHMMHPLFTESEIGKTRSHFYEFVLGRGRIPAIRVGSQPYGILATSAYSKFNYGSNPKDQELYLHKLYEHILKPMEPTWDGLKWQVPRVTDWAPNKSQQFLDVLGLHPSSVEFYQRYATGPFFLWNVARYSRTIPGWAQTYSPVSAPYESLVDVDGEFTLQGFTPLSTPRIYDLVYADTHKYLNGPVIDKLNLSEIRRVEGIGSTTQNYIDWLAISSWEQIKNENFSNIGASGAVPPKALLYLLLRHSCLLEYVRSGLTMLVNNGHLSATAMLDHELVNIESTSATEIQSLVYANAFIQEGVAFEASLDAQVESEFVYRANQGWLNGITLNDMQVQMSDYRSTIRANGESAFLRDVDNNFNAQMANLQVASTKQGLLLDRYPFMTEGDTLHAYIDARVFMSASDAEIAEMVELRRSLNCLKDIPTARLERCFAEHIDLVSYRLDAWYTSLAAQRLKKIRTGPTDRRKGVYIGAYGWLEDVLPEHDRPGIHYAEVDIRPGVVRAPFTWVETRPTANLPATVVADDYRGPMQEDAVAQLTSPVMVEGGEAKVAPLVYGRPEPLDAVYERYPFLATPDTTYTGISYAGAKGVLIDTGTPIIYVNHPFGADTELMADMGPFCTYLGTGDSGHITYDSVKDRFVHAPWVNPRNNGYIHAPSINHATAAAVLRAGYVSHLANPGSPSTALAVNLTSNRVRRAMFYIEGIRNGQELGALLGYQLERGLHDFPTSLDQHIFEFRKKYPLVAGRVTSGTVSNITTAEAYNVINGLALIEGNPDPVANYPYGVAGLPGPGAAKDAIVSEVRKLHDAMDAVSDLLMAESMFQVVQGNHPRAGNALNALAGKDIPAEPQIIATPRNFHAITHRTGIQFDLTPGGEIMWTTSGTPRSTAEPALNRWLAAQLPNAAQIAFNYNYNFIAFDDEETTTYAGTANASNLGLEPIDLYYLLTQPAEKGDAAELVERIAWYVTRDLLAAGNVQVEILFTDRTGLASTAVTLGELQPLVDALHKLILDSRPLTGKDYLMANNADALIAANSSAGINAAPLGTRMNIVSGMLNTAITTLQTAVNDAKDLLVSMAGFIGVSSYDQLANALKTAALLGVSNAYPVMEGADIQAGLTNLIARAERAIADLLARQTKANALLTSTSATQEEAARKLSEAARLIFGRAFKVFPEFTLYNPTDVNVALGITTYLVDAGPEGIEEWLQGLSPVRKRIRGWHTSGLLAEALKGTGGQLDLTIAQLQTPDGTTTNIRWLGGKFPSTYEMPGEVLSTVFSLPSGYNPANLQAGILVDEWTEEIPKKSTTTGIAVHYNNPDSEPGQTCLLAISPDETGNWSWDDLMSTLDETLEWAKKRAVDPDLLKNTIYAHVLPAVVAAISGTDDSPTLDLGRNIIPQPNHGIFDMIKLKDYPAL